MIQAKKYNNRSISPIPDLVEPPGMQVPRLGLGVSSWQEGGCSIVRPRRCSFGVAGTEMCFGFWILSHFGPSIAANSTRLWRLRNHPWGLKEEAPNSEYLQGFEEGVSSADSTITETPGGMQRRCAMLFPLLADRSHSMECQQCVCDESWSDTESGSVPKATWRVES